MDIIQKLKIKPKQENKIDFEVNIKKGAIKVAKKRGITSTKDDVSLYESSKQVTRQKGLLIDKTDEGFNRQEFLKLFKRKVVKAKPKEPKIITPIDISPTKVVFRFIRKIERKIKLKSRIKKPRKGERKKIRVTRQKDIPVPEGMVSISEFKDRLYEKAKPTKLRYSSFFLNNREKFTSFINSFYTKHKSELVGKQDITCEKIAASKAIGEFSLLTHQKIVRDYINLKTPYRGLLLYHGLGAGKTCGSISIAEGLKSNKKIIVMAPASLIPNYIGEIKFCGDPIYKLNQYWDFISTDGQSDKETKLSQILSIPKSFIRKNKGAWLVNKRKESNFSELSSDQKNSLNIQINKMIENKYNFIAYNGYRMSHLENDSNGFTKNPFDNKVIIIDEAHNLVSRIVNKINKTESLSYKLYDYLMSAQNCKIVLLTGTPIINYPNEIGILFNIIRGYIKTFKIPLNVKTRKTVNLAIIKNILKSGALADYIDYSPKTKILTITRNPFGFISNYKKSYTGVKFNEAGNISDDDFIDRVKGSLFHPKGEDREFIIVNKENIVIENYKCLPDKLDDFNALFKNSDNTVKNPELFKRRIVGLTSYFRSAQEALMPRYDYWKNLHVVKVEMSDPQLNAYQLARDSERSQSKRNAKKLKKAGKGADGLYAQTTSTYRIFSRAFCNFVFPNVIERPMPKNDLNMKKLIKGKEINEEDFDGVNAIKRVRNLQGNFDIDDIDEVERDVEKNMDQTYEQRIQTAINELKASDYLSVDNLDEYSPKFLQIYNTIVEKDGLHLIYSQFKTLEGIGIFKLVLEANGFAELKLKKIDGIYQLDISEGDKGKPMFASYTGDEEVAEKEILRWIFNSEWDKIPINIKTELNKIAANNYYGEIVKVFMITASGAEGITLKNTRYVHIMEPYWHPVRVEQVIGRARRICSHEALKEEEKSVDVYVYLSTFSEEQMKTDGKINQELKVNDLSKIDGKTVMTTDETLWEISQIKENINKNILLEVKESSIDCQIYNKADNQEKLKCLSFGKSSSDTFSNKPNYEDEEKDSVGKINKRASVWEGQKVKIGAVTYVAKLPVRKDGILEIYDYESFKYVKKYGTGNTTFIGLFNAKTNSWVEEMVGGSNFAIIKTIPHTRVSVKTNTSKQHTNKPSEKPEDGEGEDDEEDDSGEDDEEDDGEDDEEGGDEDDNGEDGIP